MLISDLITVHEAARAVDLASVGELAEALAREGADLTFGTAAQLRELLGEYVAGETEPVDVLRVILSAVVAGGETGGAFLVRGTPGSGKSHLLSALDLLLQSPAAWSVFLESHGAYADLRQRLNGKRFVVVPVPLSEHRGHDEHLEDIVFDRTEQILRSPAHSIALPLSEQSYALDLVDRHIVPRYAKELDGYCRKNSHGQSWERMRARRPAQAVELARRFAQEMHYPLDFRQSRVERLSRLLEIVRESNLAGIVWLVDDLHVFLSGVGTKAVHSDCSFLDFIGQRAKIAPVHMVAALGESLEQLTSVEPYVLNAIRASYRTDLALTREHMRTVARRRVIARVDPEHYAAAMGRARDAYVSALGGASFSPGELTESYPLHPAALRCLESIVARFFGAADTLVAFLQDLLDETTMAGVLARDFRHLVGVQDVFNYLRPRIASHPEVAAYIYDALDYYQKNGHEVFPENPALTVSLAQALIVFRLANVSAPASLILEALGLDDSGHPVADPDLVRRALEAMRLMGSFVDSRRGAPDSQPVYVVDVHTNMSEALRRRIAAAKASYSPEDPKLWRHAISAADDPGFPLAQLTESRTLEVQWENSSRCVATQLVDLAEVTPADAAEIATDLADPATVEDAHLFVARPAHQALQLRAWQEVRETAPATRWAAALIAWIPRDLKPDEADALKEFAAVSDLLEDQAALGAEPGLRERLSEMRVPLLGRVRQILRNAYHQGQVLSPFGHAVTPDELHRAEGDWSRTLAVVTERAFLRVFPDFPGIAPRRPISTREQIDLLVERVIRPGSLPANPDDPLSELVQSFLAPLGIAVRREDTWYVEPGASRLANDIMARVRSRDQSPQHQLGRPLSCSDLAQHLLKSTLGLPPELFELLVASLLRTGYLAPLRDRTQLVRFDDVPTPLSGSIQYVARAPLLGPTQWQILTRVCRIVLDSGLPGPELSVQNSAWERLLQARLRHLDHAESLRRNLEAHTERLGQRPAQWRNSLEAIEALERLFHTMRPDLHPAVAVQEFVQDIEPLVGDAQGASRLSGLFRAANAIGAYLEKVAPDVVAVQDYLTHPQLHIEPGEDMDARRQSVLELIRQGEELIPGEVNLRRQVQIFMAAYKRRYISWHGRVYRAPVFDQYRSVHQTPEMRALTQLGKLHLDVDITAADVAQRVDAQAARRCVRPDLNEALDELPICPDCRIRLNEEPEILPVEALVQETDAALRGYLRAITNASTRQALLEYARSMARRGDTQERLEAIAALQPDATPRELMTLITDDAIPHLNRVLSGKRLAPRNLGELRDQLEGRTLTKEDAQQLFTQWLEGQEEGLESDGLLQIEE